MELMEKVYLRNAMLSSNQIIDRQETTQLIRTNQRSMRGTKRWRGVQALIHRIAVVSWEVGDFSEFREG